MILEPESGADLFVVETAYEPCTNKTELAGHSLHILRSPHLVEDDIWFVRRSEGNSIVGCLLPTVALDSKEHSFGTDSHFAYAAGIALALLWRDPRVARLRRSREPISSSSFSVTYDEILGEDSAILIIENGDDGRAPEIEIQYLSPLFAALGYRPWIPNIDGQIHPTTALAGWSMELSPEEDRQLSATAPPLFLKHMRSHDHRYLMLEDTSPELSHELLVQVLRRIDAMYLGSSGANAFYNLFQIFELLMREGLCTSILESLEEISGASSSRRSYKAVARLRALFSEGSRLRRLIHSSQSAIDRLSEAQSQYSPLMDAVRAASDRESLTDSADLLYALRNFVIHSGYEFDRALDSQLEMFSFDCLYVVSALLCDFHGSPSAQHLSTSS